MKKINLLVYLYLLISVSLIYSQTTKEEFLSDIRFASGVYQPYIFAGNKPTPPPKGYKPFYLSHYGRHGSRYLEPAESYTNPYNTLNEAYVSGKLTTFGESLFDRVKTIVIDAENRYGDVTSLGIKEHKEIAERMFNSYPEIFSLKDGRKPFIYSRSTVVPRCILSMSANNERLKELNPEIIIERNATKRDTYLGNSYKNSNRDSINAVSKSFIANNFDVNKFITKVFSDTTYVNEKIKDKIDFISKIYYLCADVQDLNNLDVNMSDVFSKEELYVLWQAANIKLYLVFTSKVAVDSSKKLLKNIIDCADNAIKNNNISADLRFGHDSYISPLLTLMDIEGINIKEDDPNNIYKIWCDFKVTPMAVNIQFVFYRSDENNDILVKILHNEKEVKIPIESVIAPYYNWRDVKSYYENKILQ